MHFMYKVIIKFYTFTYPYSYPVLQKLYLHTHIYETKERAKNKL